MSRTYLESLCYRVHITWADVWAWIKAKSPLSSTIVIDSTGAVFDVTLNVLDESVFTGLTENTESIDLAEDDKIDFIIN